MNINIKLLVKSTTRHQRGHLIRIIISKLDQ